MANEVVKVNSIAIASITKINGQTDTDLAKFNGQEFTCTVPYDGITWATGATDTHRGGHGGTGTVEAFLIAGRNG